MVERVSSSEKVRVVCFDVDGTLLRHDEDLTVWQLLNERAHGTADINKTRFAAFREGEISYEEWVTLDILDWKAHGLRRPAMERLIRASLRRTPDALETLAELRVRGYGLAVISGTLDLTLELMLDGFRFDRAYTNGIDFDAEGKIAGWRATPFDVGGKARALDVVAGLFGVSVAQCAFVGDSWNDIHAFRRAGFSVAYRPKVEELRGLADVVIDEDSLAGLLDLFSGAVR
jgi:phosphoserine phosphatase